MPLTNEGTVVRIPASRTPSDFSQVPVATFADHEYISTERTLSVLKSTVQNADPATTLLAIIADATIGINRQVSDIVTAEYETVGGTVTCFTIMTGIDSNVSASAANDFLTATAMSYQCTVIFYVKSTL